ncbi:major facilitator superfamily domain-containing protein [Desarmillaria tabescens]|uniref:Major facilitator superfamily domain-containing protein n=1 Tax=Armillaria tabescens TaxID=1929756 RepID=A0AA39T393_ARMTA|nr:major facilitator superfamily domain-containing protein [Desarmillaria tabescens]KAK0461336.1 major facilitator superfamily domain-containing protein [Desarmillaria tabescens]
MSVDSSQQLEKPVIDQELPDLQPIKRDKENPIVHPISVTSDAAQSPLEYRLYKRRFVGVFGFVVLNIVAAMSWPWFGPIANETSQELGFSLNRVNWLGNIMACIYLPVAILIPPFISRYGLRRCCDVGALCLILSSWIRYAGTSRSLSTQSSYALLMFGQLFASVSQPIYQVLGPKYSETWFNLQGRTTATMIIAISNPIGGAIGQLLSPLVGDTRQSILVLGIISTAATPCVFLIRSTPPTPPTYAASRTHPSLLSFVKRVLGLDKTPGEYYMTVRERFDFGIIWIIFSSLVAATNTFALLSAEIMEPVGYSSDTSGLMGACLLLTGIVAAIVTAPLFDRVFTRHLAITTKIAVPIVAVVWLSMIWAVKPNNTGGLFTIMTILGVGSVPMLPVALELGCDLTRNAEASSSLLWFGGNLFAIMFILDLVMDALRAGPDAEPPLNMRRALIFNGAFVLAAASFVALLQGKQVRKDMDEIKLQESTQTRRTDEEAPP